MISPVAAIMVLYVLPGLALTCLILALLVRVSEGRAVLRLRAGVLEFELPVSNAAAVRAGIALLSLVFFLMLVFHDFSGLFPRSLEMDVFFDQRGIEASLASLSDDEIRSLGIPDEYAAMQQEYYQRLDSELQPLRATLDSMSVFCLHRTDIHSEGETKFLVDKVGGFQRYHVSEVEGELDHYLDLPGHPRIHFHTWFEKHNSMDDYFTASLVDLVSGRGILLRPEFEQKSSMSKDLTGPVFSHTVVGATKVFVYPYPGFGPTVYLAEAGDGVLVPVGYALYRGSAAQ